MDNGFSEMISSRAKALKDEDFMEEDMWPVNFKKEREGSSLKAKRAQDSSSASLAPACGIPAVPRVIPRVNSGSQNQYVTHHQSSAPVNIPDWSKVHMKKSNRNDAWAAADGNGGNRVYFADAQGYDDDEDSDEMVPPHEFIARRLARSPVVSFSMCEGVGRTLKGRDLSKLRNAILTKTGFLE